MFFCKPKLNEYWVLPFQKAVIFFSIILIIKTKLLDLYRLDSVINVHLVPLKILIFTLWNFCSIILYNELILYRHYIGSNYVLQQIENSVSDYCMIYDLQHNLVLLVKIIA